MIEALSFETVIIVACVCGSVVLVLSIILIVLCCQRHRSKDLYEKTETNIMEPSEAASAAGGSTPAVASGGGNGTREQGRAVTLPHQHQQHPQQERDVSPCQQGMECEDTQRNHRSSNSALAYSSLDRGATSHTQPPHPSAAAATDDKRPRKVIYEVVV